MVWILRVDIGHHFARVCCAAVDRIVVVLPLVLSTEWVISHQILVHCVEHILEISHLPAAFRGTVITLRVTYIHCGSGPLKALFGVTSQTVGAGRVESLSGSHPIHIEILQFGH